MDTNTEHQFYNNQKQETVQAELNNYSNPSPFHPADVADSGNLHKIRDILFGKEMRDYDKKFARIEELLVKECTQLRNETIKRLDALETYIKKEVESLTERLKTEQVERQDATRNLAQEQKNMNLAIESKLSQFEDQTSQGQRELREQILDQSKSLHDEIRQKYAEILILLERETKELQTTKTDRSTLAALLADMAMRLNT